VSQQTPKESRWAAGLAGNERGTAHQAFLKAGWVLERGRVIAQRDVAASKAAR
jgi:hypothetical protein